MEGITRITGRHNERLAAVRKVRDGRTPGSIFIEGARVTREAMRSRVRIVECVMTPEILQSHGGNELAAELISREASVIEVPEQLFRSLADTIHSQGIILIAERPESGRQIVANEMDLNEAGVIVFLQKINDPSNLGAVYRAAEAAGAGAIIVSSGSANVFSPKAIRAAMGANLRIPTWDNANLEECVGWARAAGFSILAADISGSKSHFEIDWKRSSMIVFGNEAHGLSRKDLELTDEVFRIPMQNDVESLNLAVSAGVVLYEVRRQIDRK